MSYSLKQMSRKTKVVALGLFALSYILPIAGVAMIYYNKKQKKSVIYQYSTSIGILLAFCNFIFDYIQFISH